MLEFNRKLPDTAARSCRNSSTLKSKKENKKVKTKIRNKDEHILIAKNFIIAKAKKEKGTRDKSTGTARVNGRGSRKQSRLLDDCVHVSKHGVEVKEKERIDGRRNSLNESGIGGEPERDTSDGFGNTEAGSLQR